MSHADYLTSDQLCRALNLRDLTDPSQGEHAIQALLDSVVGALRSEWGCTVRYVRNSPVVPVRENYDRLGYDAVDRSHVGEPHQVDLWRIRAGGEDLLTMIGRLVETVFPGAQWKTTEVTHPYTVGGRQIDVLHEGEWLELAACGRIHPEVLRGSGLDPEHWSGLALGMGLERALMLRKGIPDIRYLRAEDPRIATPMLTLDT